MKSLVRISELKMVRRRSGIPGRKEAEGSASSTPWKYMARTRKVHHYAISGGGEYLCEFSSLVLKMSLGRISESERKEQECKIVRKIDGIPGRKQWNLATFLVYREDFFLIIFRRDI